MSATTYAAVLVFSLVLTSTTSAQTARSTTEKAAPPNTGATTSGGASVGTMNAGNNPQANASDGRRPDAAPGPADQVRPRSAGTAREAKPKTGSDK